MYFEINNLSHARPLLRLIVAAVALFLACSARAQIVLPQVPDSLRSRFDGRTTAPVEGIWQIVDGATISIQRGAKGFDIICLESPDLRLRPGTVLGSLDLGDAVGGKYNASMYTDIDNNGNPCRRHRFALTLTGDNQGVMTLTPTKKFKLDFWLLYRLLFTVSLRNSDKPDGLRAIRIYPDRALSPDFPIVL